MKKLLILGAGQYQVPIIEQAKAMGLYTIVVSPDGDYPGLKTADKVYYLDVRDERSILEVAKKEEIAGVTTDQTDIAVRTVAFVAAEMNLPGIGYDCARLFTDKYLMRKMTRRLGLPTIEYRMVHDINDARDFFVSLEGNAIIKPVDNQGSRGVFLIHSEEELEADFAEAQQFSASGQVIIERHITGREFEVDSILVDHDEKTLMYADTDLFDIPNVFASRTRLYPSVADTETIHRLLDLNHKIITGFGLKQGLTHSEYIMDEKSGEIYLIEAAARGGGSYISSHIGRLQTGLNTSEFLVDLATGEIDKIPEFETARCHCGYVTFFLPEGVVADTASIEDVARLPYVYKHTLDDIKVGMKTESFSDKSARYVVIAQAQTREMLDKRIDEIRNILQIKVKTDDGIKGPVWK